MLFVNVSVKWCTFIFLKNSSGSGKTHFALFDLI